MLVTALYVVTLTSFTLFSNVQAYLQDPNGEECVGYSYAPVASALSAFPPIWTPASILTSDEAANAKYNAISSSIPNIAQHGTNITGNFSAFTPTYPPTDPDCWWSYSKCTTPKISGLLDDIINTPEPLTLGYGFDDGPYCGHNAFYDYLSEHNQKATMFYIGSNVMNWPYEAMRGIEDGHEICAHTWSHHYMTAMNNSEAFAELYYSIQAIKLVTGVTVTCWRPPYGDVDDRIRWIANALGLRTTVWSYDSNDWRYGTANVTNATVNADYQAVVTAAQNGTFNTAGTIILTHELNNYTMSEAIAWYPTLKATFKALVPVGVSLNKTQPYVETGYALPTFEQYITGETQVNATNTTSGSGASSSAAGKHESAGRQDAVALLSVYALMLVGAVLLLV